MTFDIDKAIDIFWLESRKEAEEKAMDLESLAAATRHKINSDRAAADAKHRIAVADCDRRLASLQSRCEHPDEKNKVHRGEGQSDTWTECQLCGGEVR